MQKPICMNSMEISPFHFDPSVLTSHGSSAKAIRKRKSMIRILKMMIRNQEENLKFELTPLSFWTRSS